MGHFVSICYPPPLSKHQIWEYLLKRHPDYQIPGESTPTLIEGVVILFRRIITLYKSISNNEASQGDCCCDLLRFSDEIELTDLTGGRGSIWDRTSGHCTLTGESASKLPCANKTCFIQHNCCLWLSVWSSKYSQGSREQFSIDIGTVVGVLSCIFAFLGYSNSNRLTEYLHGVVGKI